MHPMHASQGQESKQHELCMHGRRLYKYTRFTCAHVGWKKDFPSGPLICEGETGSLLINNQNFELTS